MSPLSSSGPVERSPVYSLNCSVCKARFFRKRKWEQHLTQEFHQNLARVQDYHKSKINLKECSLVIFTTYDLTVKVAYKLIQYFSRDTSTFVTDFVWWEDRPRIGIVQFESRKIVEELLKDMKTKSKPILINNQEVQVKGALDMLDLEWKAILPGNYPFPLSNSTQMTDHSQDGYTIQNELTKSADHINNTTQLVPEKPSNYLFLQLQEVCNVIKIPDKKSKTAHNTVRIFRNHLQDKLASSKVVIFRNRYLNLKNFTTSEIDPLLVYVYTLPELKSQGDDTFISGSLIERYAMDKNLFRRCSSKETHHGLEFIHNLSKSSFFVMNSKHFMAEVQLSQLAKYYFDFDTRIRPLFYLAQYWKITNGILFGQTEVAEETFRKCLPEPYCLYWMLITFLIHDNYLPSVRTILERPHTPIIEEETGTDIGFHKDPLFASQWKVEHKTEANSPYKFVMTVLQLFYKFLQFCSTQVFDKGGVIINPKDGEISKRSQVLRGNWKSKLSSKEISIICANLKENSTSCWYMIHPLVTDWRFSVPEKNLEQVTNTVLKKTIKKFKNLLKLIELRGAENAFQICGENLLEILKVNCDRGASRKRNINETIDENNDSCRKKCRK